MNQKKKEKGEKCSAKICKHIKKKYLECSLFFLMLIDAFLGCLYFFLIFNPVISSILTKQVTFYHLQQTQR